MCAIRQIIKRYLTASILARYINASGEQRNCIEANSWCTAERPPPDTISQGTPRIEHLARGGCAPQISRVSLIGKTAVSKTVYGGSIPSPSAQTARTSVSSTDR